MPEFKIIPGTDLTVCTNPPWESSWLQGYIDVPFSRLVEVFGEPGPGDGGEKVSCEWELLLCEPLSRPIRVTVYDYKQETTPGQLRREDFRGWHVGGTDPRAVDLLHRALGLPIPAPRATLFA